MLSIVLFNRLLSTLVLFLLSGSVYASSCNGDRAALLSVELLDRVSEVNNEYSAQLEEISESGDSFLVRRLPDTAEFDSALGYEAVISKSSCKVLSVAQIEPCDDGYPCRRKDGQRCKKKPKRACPACS